MIIKKLHTFQASIVVLFIVAFSSVFVCDFLCDLGIVEIRQYSHQHEELVDHTDLFTKHHHGDDAHHNDGQQPDKEHDDCCEEETNALYRSLIKHQFETFDLDTHYFQLSVIVFALENITSITKAHLIGDIYFLDLPPPSSWDIRIFIQSFLN